MAEPEPDVPADPLRSIFTGEVVQRLRTAPQTRSLAYRLATVADVDASRPKSHTRWLEAQRSAWNAYLEASIECGLLEEPHGRDITARLTQSDDDQFRSAMAECQAAWYLANKLGLNVSARPQGKGNSELELLAKLPDGDVYIEVKSPFREATDAGWVDDSDILDRCLADASKQFRRDTRNLLMLVGRVTLGADHRSFFVKAFYAAERWLIDRDTMESRVAFDYTGRFLKVWPGDKEPRHRRVGGVLFVEENVRAYDTSDEGVGRRVEHDALMMHNPHALNPLPEAVWGDCPQLVPRGSIMEWTDGFPTGGETPS